MNTSNTITQKIKSMSKALSIILKFARIFCYIGIGISVCALIYVLFFGNIDLLILKGDVILRSPFTDASFKDMDFKQLLVTSVIGIIGMALMANLFLQAQNIFKDISKDGSPFEMKHVKRIKRVAILYLIISLLDSETSALSISISFNMVGIVGALMFYCIALVFEYGCALQQESDEIL